MNEELWNVDLALLSGRAVAVTGGGDGLGRQYALAAAAHGASVCVNDIEDSADRVVDEIRATGGSAEAVIGDIAEWNTAQRLIDRCVETYGKIDCLVNNAGILHICDPWVDTEADIRRAVDTNYLGTFFAGTIAIARMQAQGFGTILNASSGIGQAGHPAEAAYCSTKAAVTTLTYCWALALRGHGVRVNAICPTGDTPMLKVTRAHRATTVEWPPDWAASLMLYLVSDLSAPMTGQVVRLWDRALAVMTHPKLAAPTLDPQSPWTVSEIAAAFDDELKDSLQPIGLNNVEPRLG